MSSVHVAPATVLTGRDALADAVPAIASLGDRFLWAGTERGRAGRLGSVRGELTRRSATVIDADHRGPCTEAAVTAIRGRAEVTRVDALIAIGGGRVIDVVKAAADDLRRPFVAIPTSPATCAAVTPLSVMYEADGRYRSTRPTRRTPDLVVLDPDTLTGADDRLLTAGILDALAKVHEVRRTSGDAAEGSATSRAALSLCDDLEALLVHQGEAAVAAGPGASRVRALVAEAAVLVPGLIGGLAGERAKLAAAHPLHNALTALPGSQRALHGELVGFGVLVQIVLTGASEATVRSEAARFARLGVACHLEALGCDSARGPAGLDVARATVATPAMAAAFPDVDAEMLFEAMLRVDAWSRDEARHVPRRSPSRT